MANEGGTPARRQTVRVTPVADRPDKPLLGDVAEGLEILYSRYFLRDFVAKIVPGGMLVAAILVLLYGPDATNSFWKSANIGMTVMLAAGSWIVGVSLQGVGNKIGLVRYSRKTVEGSLAESIRFADLASADERVRDERITIIKEATGTFAFASLLIGIFFVVATFFLSPIWSIATAFSPVAAKTWLLAGAWTVLAAFAAYMHRDQVRQQERYRGQIIGKSDTGLEPPKPVAKAAPKN